MTRAQRVIRRGNKILMVKERYQGMEHWCLPGGRVEDGRTNGCAIGCWGRKPDIVVNYVLERMFCVPRSSNKDLFAVFHYEMQTIACKVLLLT